MGPRACTSRSGEVPSLPGRGTQLLELGSHAKRRVSVHAS